MTCGVPPPARHWARSSHGRRHSGPHRHPLIRKPRMSGTGNPQGLDVKERPLLQRREKCFLLTSPFIEPGTGHGQMWTTGLCGPPESVRITRAMGIVRDWRGASNYVCDQCGSTHSPIRLSLSDYQRAKTGYVCARCGWTSCSDHPNISSSSTCPRCGLAFRS